MQKQQNNDAWTIDEKWGLGCYVWCEQANTLANRDYKQPQTLIRLIRRSNELPKDNRPTDGK